MPFSAPVLALSRLRRVTQLLMRPLIPLAALVLSAPAWSFDLEDVAAQAQELAGKPFQAPDAKLPDALESLSYDAYRQIRYKPEKAIWHSRNLPFEIQLFHPGASFRAPVKVNLVGIDGPRELKFRPEDFDYGPNAIDPEALKNLSFAGFRVHYAVNRPDYKDEVLAFRGASYFRALGKDQRYGQSARGLAVDTGLLSGEEFPYFREFWIAWPSNGDDYLVVYALLDSRRVTGAYRFELHPGTSTRMDVQSRLFLREGVGKLGIAPLTSMFQFGENQRNIDDYRPEVHDTDGLLVQSGDHDWIWRPLTNPRRLLVTSFATQTLRGFGLMQRDRAFADYQDLEARFELRPSVWVTPKGDWGAGRVELVQIPTPDDTNDNIVAYWVRDAAPLAGQSLDVAYSLSWQMLEPTEPPTSHAVQTRRGRGAGANGDNSVRMVVDFEGPALDKLPPDAPLFAGLTISEGGELLERQVYHNDATGGWRLSFRFRRVDDQKPVEMRAFLKHEDEIVSETWSYILPPA